MEFVFALHLYNIKDEVEEGLGERNDSVPAGNGVCVLMERL